MLATGIRSQGRPELGHAHWNHSERRPNGASVPRGSIRKPIVTRTLNGDPVRVLVAEDNVVNQKVAVKLLEKLGIRADVAADGREAVELCASPVSLAPGQAGGAARSTPARPRSRSSAFSS